LFIPGMKPPENGKEAAKPAAKHMEFSEFSNL